MKRMKKSIISWFLVLAMILGMMPTTAFASEAAVDTVNEETSSGENNGAAESVDVTFTVSQGEAFYTAEESEVILMDKELSVPYFDLALYGLEEYYYDPDCYAGETQVAGTPEIAEGYVTIMHLFLYATEIYKCGLGPEEAGQGYLLEAGLMDDVIGWSGAVGSSFMTMWDLGYNLNYYLNYEYPIGKPGWGATCDQIVLEDGDRVDLHAITSKTAFGSSFSFFTVNDVRDNAVVTKGDSAELTLWHTQSNWTEFTTEYVAAADETVYYTSANGASGNPKDWTEFAVTDENGTVTLSTEDLEAGTYYVATLGFEDVSAGIEYAPALFTLVVEEPVPENQVPALAEGVEASAQAEFNVGETYSQNLSEIFADADGDALAYKVSVNGAEAVEAAADYTYIAEEAGEVILVFTANDGKADSTDTFTVTLTVKKVAEPVVVYKHGVDGSNWINSSYYVDTVTISGAEVTGYKWSGDSCSVALMGNTAKDAAVTFTVTLGGRSASQIDQLTINGENCLSSKTYTMNLTDGEASVPIYVRRLAALWSRTKTFNLFVNNAPVLAEGQVSSVDAQISANEAYEVDLANLFADADEDALTYEVKVNDGEYTSVEGTSYSHTESVGGIYQLTFRAYDGKGYSTDTYTVDLTVQNSSVTYPVTVNVPEGVEPVFYTTNGADENGLDVVNEVLTASKDGTVYTVAVPENISRISYRADDMGMSVEVSAENNTVDLRVVNFDVQSLAGVEITSDQAAVEVAYGDYKAVGNGYNYLLAAGEGYTYTATPGSAISGTYKAVTMEAQSVEAGEDALIVIVTLNFSAPKQITADSDATVQMFYQTKYYVQTELQPVLVVDNGDGTTTYTYNDGRSGGYGAGFSYRVSKEGCITKAGYYPSGLSNPLVTWEGETDTPSTRKEYDATTAFGSRGDDSILVNVNGQNHLVLNEGQTFRMRAFRIWEIIDSDTTNLMIEPDFHYTGYDTDMLTIVSANESLTGQVSGNATNNWVDITANKAGTTFLEVSYDALEIVTGYEAGSWGGAAGQPSNYTYNACDPDRTALVVVQVGNAATDVTFGINCLSSNVSGNYYEADKAVQWDAEFDTLYFTGDSEELTLSPTTASGTIAEVAVSVDKGETWTVLEGEEGVYTAEILAGNNVIRVTKEDGTTAYQVVRGDKVTVTVNNVTNPGEALKPGDTAQIVFDGVHFPTGKMSGIYNPGYGFGHRVTYTFNEATVQTGAPYQYNFISNAKLEVTIPEDATSATYTLTDGYLVYNIMGNGPGSHRGLTDGGASVNTGASSSRYTKCLFPDITLNVELPDAEIITQPADYEGKVGEIATFTVETAGTVNSYQWQYKNVNSSKWYNSGFEGANEASHNVPIGKFRDGQQYRCIVTGIVDGKEVQLVSDAASVIVTKAAVVITSQPVDFEGEVGETAVFTVAAEGEGLTYQWQYRKAGAANWYNSTLEGNDTATQNVVIASYRDGQQYRCIITDAEGNELVTDVVTLRIAPPAIVITSQPADYEGKVGETATFTVAAEGEGLTYQWQYKNANASKWYNSSLEGYDTETQSVTVAAYRNGQQYRCVITDAEGNVVTSKAAAIVVAAE